MTFARLKNALDSMSIGKSYYGIVPNGTALPFVTWKLNETENIPADNVVYKQRAIVYVYLYTPYKNFVLEQELEHIFRENEIFWDKEETNGTDEATNIVIYTIEITIEE